VRGLTIVYVVGGLGVVAGQLFVVGGFGVVA
jgi:hypothetical protein